FGREKAVDRHSVNSAGQFPVVPRFGAVREPQPVQILVRGDHVASNPRPFGPVAAGADDLAKSTVKGDGELAGADGPGQSVGDVHSRADVENGPWVGRPPENRVAVTEPGENSLGIRPQQTGRVEVAANSDEPVLVGKRRRDPGHVRVAIERLHFSSFSRSFFASAADLVSGYFSMMSFSVALALSGCFRLI